MSLLDRLRRAVTEDEAGGWDDAIIVGGVMLVLYLAYIVTGVLLGYDVNGLANTLRRVTFLTAVYSLVVLALNLQWGYAGLFNIGVIGFMAVGVYSMAILTAPVHPATSTAIPGFGLPLPLAMAIGMGITAIVGFLTALPALRLRADYLAIVTIGISEIIRFTLKSTTFQKFTVFGKTMGTGGGSGMTVSADPETVVVDTFLTVDGLLGSPLVSFGTSLGIQQTVITGWVYALFLVVILVAFYWLLKRVGNSPFGRVLRAIKEDEDATNALGKDTNRFKIKVFMLGTALMGLAGMLWQGSQGYLNPNAFRPETTFFVWIALIIGGAGSNTGSILGSAFFAALLFEGPRYVQNIVQRIFEIGSPPANVIDALVAVASLEFGPFFAYVVSRMSAVRLILMGVVLIWLMHNRPDGLLGHRKEPATAVPILGSRPGGSDDE